ncbi:MAG: SDR family oxidoreductase [Rhodothermales bacterium]|nr:SDR family oxidoreductase [Rhodothermales bacterium]MBO6779996.1 SDR family oxidoreductase [Rhodothermales bacterium]
MSRIQDATLLITGGASGIGRLMAASALQKGAARVVLWDINKAGLDETVSELGDRVSGDVVDMSSAEQIREAATHLPSLDILINNAGIIVGKDFADHTAEDIDRTLGVNIRGPMHLASAVLPAMLDRGTGHIVNIASAAGIVAAPKLSAYSASKFAMVGFSDSLRLEMQRDDTGIRVTCVQPFYIHTGMFSGVTSPIIPIMKPDDAVRRIMKAIERDAAYLRMPALVKLGPFLKGVLPRPVFEFTAGKVFGIYDAMNGFRGRD